MQTDDKLDGILDNSKYNNINLKQKIGHDQKAINRETSKPQWYPQFSFYLVSSDIILELNLQYNPISKSQQR